MKTIFFRILAILCAMALTLGAFFCLWLFPYRSQEAFSNMCKKDSYDIFCVDMVDAFDQAYGNTADVESRLDFMRGEYHFLDKESDSIKKIPLNEDILDWWKDYAPENIDTYRRPVPAIRFDGTKFVLDTISIEGMAERTELTTIDASSVVHINDYNVVYEFLMRTYGIRKEDVRYIVLESTLELSNNGFPYNAKYLWVDLGDTKVYKIPINHQYGFEGTDEFFIGFPSGHNQIFNLNAYIWNPKT